MSLEGKGASGGALTVVNAIPTGKGAAVGLDLTTHAHVSLEPEPGPIEVTIEQDDQAQAAEGARSGEDPEEVDPSLARACIQRIAEALDQPLSGRVRTSSEIPIERGLKSSSAAANAIVLATLDALDEEAPAEQVLAWSVQAAREAGVTVTGALDDAAACLLGGLVVTDNAEDRILRRKRLDASSPVLLLVPETRRRTDETGPLDEAAPVARHALAALEEEDWPRALTLNGLGVAAALGSPMDPIYRALLAGASAAGVSGTGPAIGAVCPEQATAAVRGAWEPYASPILTVGMRDGRVTA